MTICSLKNLNTGSVGMSKTFSNNFFQANKKIIFILEILMNMGSFHSFHFHMWSKRIIEEFKANYFLILFMKIMADLLRMTYRVDRVEYEV